MTDESTLQPEGAVRQRLKQAAFRHLKHHLKAELEEKPSRCQHNTPLQNAPGPICYCGVDWSEDDGENPGCCDDRHTPNQAKGCPQYVPKIPKEKLKAAFQDFLARAPITEIARRYPEIAALLWVLGDEAPGREVPLGEWCPGSEVEVEVYGITVSTMTPQEASDLEERVSDAERGAWGVREKLVEAERKLEDLGKAHEKVSERESAATARIKELEADLLRLEGAEREAAKWKMEADLAKSARDTTLKQNTDLRKKVQELEKEVPPAQLPVPTGIRGVFWRWLTGLRP